MRARTALAVVLVVAGLAGVVVFGVGVPGSGGGLTELWVSDTPRENERNHHAVGASADGRVVVAPVAEVPNEGTALTDTSCTLARLNATDGAVEWRTVVPPERCFTHALTEPVVADLTAEDDRSTDRSGSDATDLSVVAATTENALVAYDAADGSERWRVPLRPGNTSDELVYGYGRPTAADLTDAPGREVVASSIHGDVVLATADGDVEWRRSLTNLTGEDGTVESRPVVADVTGDGNREVVVGSYDAVVVLNADGSVAWTRPTPARGLAVAQADDDPARELLVGDGVAVEALDGATGATQWTAEFDTAVRFRAAADGDGAGAEELFLGTFDGEAVAVDVRTGDVEWRTTVSADGAPVWAPESADVDGDGDRELVATSRDGSVTVLAADGGRVLATSGRSVAVWTHATPADLDGDGDSEVLVRYGDGRVVALDYGA